jgi:hypothetical protein
MGYIASRLDATSSNELWAYILLICFVNLRKSQTNKPDEGVQGNTDLLKMRSRLHVSLPPGIKSSSSTDNLLAVSASKCNWHELCDHLS